MRDIFLFADNLSVGFFGVILSVACCRMFITWRRRIGIGIMTVLFLAFIGSVYHVLGAEVEQWEALSPLVVHVPLLLLLYIVTGRLLWPAVCILLMYMCCQLRYWLGLVITLLLHGDALTLAWTKVLITVPLLIVLVRFMVPAVQSLGAREPLTQLQVGLIPAVYYIFDYSMTVYTDLLYQGVPVVLEFMPFVCCASSLVFVLWESAKERERVEFEQMQNMLNLQVTQSLREICALRESQRQASVYRHDLRHHLQYLLERMENDQISQAKEYIRGICTELEAQKVLTYCENDTINLILSAFAGRCRNNEVQFDVCATLSSCLPVSERDLCVLLSNALENALNACCGLSGKPCIAVLMYEKKGKFFLQITNPCKGIVRFVQGLPVTEEPGHGLGVKSICAIVERNGGMYSFSEVEGSFVLRVTL